MKNYRLFSAATLLIALFFATPSLLSAQNNLPTVPYIEVRASATRKVTPDELYLKITIKESDYKGKKSLQDVQQTMVNILQKCGVNIDEALTVMSMGSSVKFKTFSSKIKTRTEAVYILKLTNADTMQKIINLLEEKEISNIVLAETKYSKIKELESELGIEAVKQAKQRATELVSAIGQEIGKAIYINSWSMNEIISPRNYKMMASRSAVQEDAAMGATTPLSITENEYSVDVNVRFELK